MGTTVYDARGNAANADWIRAARLRALADAGDMDAARKLKELFETPMRVVTLEELDACIARQKTKK